MKTAIIVSLLVIIALLLVLLYLLFQPGANYGKAGPSPRSMEAAVGRAVLVAGQADPAVAAIVRAAVQAAPEEDKRLAADLIAKLPER